MYIFSEFSELLKKCETKARVFDNALNSFKLEQKIENREKNHQKARKRNTLR